MNPHIAKFLEAKTKLLEAYGKGLVTIDDMLMTMGTRSVNTQTETAQPKKSGGRGKKRDGVTIEDKMFIIERHTKRGVHIFSEDSPDVRGYHKYSADTIWLASLQEGEKFLVKSCNFVAGPTPVIHSLDCDQPIKAKKK